MSSQTVIVRGLNDLRNLYPSYRLEYIEKDIHIRITEKLAAVARQEDPNSCLLAWAINFNLGDGYAPYTFKTLTFVVDHINKRILATQHSRKMRDVIDHFDKEGEVTPGVYLLIPVSQSRRSGAKPAGRRTPGTGKTGLTRSAAIQTPRTFRKAVVEMP